MRCLFTYATSWIHHSSCILSSSMSVRLIAVSCGTLLVLAMSANALPRIGKPPWMYQRILRYTLCMFCVLLHERSVYVFSPSCLIVQTIPHTLHIHLHYACSFHESSWLMCLLFNKYINCTCIIHCMHFLAPPLLFHSFINSAWGGEQDIGCGCASHRFIHINAR